MSALEQAFDAAITRAAAQQPHLSWAQRWTEVSA